MTVDPPRLATLTEIQAFHPCSVYGEEFTPDHLRDMTLNWEEFRDRMEPPMVLGHGERQQLAEQLKDTGIPAHGWINDIRFDPAAKDRNGTPGPALIFGAQEVQPETADMVNRRMYKKCSPEVWWRPPEQMFDNRDHLLSVIAKRGHDADAVFAAASEQAEKDFAKLQAKYESGKITKLPSVDWLTDYHMRGKLGPTVRRLALLGGEPPRNGKLADLGYAQFSDRRKDGFHTDEEYEVFMGTATMDDASATDAEPSAGDARRQRWTATLAKMGLPQDAIDVIATMPTNKLEMLGHALLEDKAGIADSLDDPAAADAADPNAVDAEEANEDSATEEAENEGDPSIEDIIADLVDMGADEEQLQDLTPDDLQKLWEEKKGASMSAPAVKTPPARRAATPVSDEVFAAALEEIREVKRENAEIKATFGGYVENIKAKEQAIQRSLRAEADAARLKEKRASEERKRAVEQILADAQKGSAPKILPAEEARYRRRLMAADNSTVAKFGDRECTEFEDIVSELEERPVVRVFGAEKARQGGVDSSIDAEVSAYVARNKRRA